jgi:hypothetical protein
VHFHRDRADQLRAQMSLPRLAYARQAEHHPSWRPRLLRYWRHTHTRALEQWHDWQRAPWLHGSWHTAALCIHRYEGSWTDTTPTYMGGLQFDAGTWAANGGTGNPGDAPVSEQLHVAYRTWRARGWTPWPNTARMCGLL